MVLRILNEIENIVQVTLQNIECCRFFFFFSHHSTWQRDRIVNNILPVSDGAPENSLGSRDLVIGPDLAPNNLRVSSGT